MPISPFPNELKIHRLIWLSPATRRFVSMRGIITITIKADTTCITDTIAKTGS